MRIPQRIKPVRPVLPFVIFGGAAVFLGIASQALAWSAASTVTVGAALALLLAFLGPPVLMLPGEIVEDRRLAASVEAKLSQELAEAIAQKERLYEECGRLRSCLEETRAGYELRLDKERRRLVEQFAADRRQLRELAKNETEITRLPWFVETQKIERGPARQGVRVRVGEHVYVGGVLPRHVIENAPEIAATSLEKIESVFGNSNVVGPDTLVHVLPGPGIAGIQRLGVEPGPVNELDALDDRTNEVSIGG